jgi:hypothetical protein
VNLFDLLRRADIKAPPESDRRYFRNEKTGYVRRGMPFRDAETSAQLVAAAEAKRARKAAKLKKAGE